MPWRPPRPRARRLRSTPWPDGIDVRAWTAFTPAAGAALDADGYLGLAVHRAARASARRARWADPALADGAYLAEDAEHEFPEVTVRDPDSSG